MKSLSLKHSVRNAIMIGGMCSISYLAVYLTRNILSAVSPQLIESGVFSTEQIGSLSSLYFITYAIGQLINGAIGDKIKGKYMISAGLVFAGVCTLIFPMIAESSMAIYAAYAMTGYFLSMIYGPMTKVVAENTEPIYATRCSLGYTFASFFGSPLAGVLAMAVAWQGVFITSSLVLFFMGTMCFCTFHLLERKGIVQFGKYKAEKSKGGNIRVLLKHRIIKFTLVSIITGVVRTTVVFWLPTYLSQYLGYSSDRSALIYTIATFIISLTAFIAVFVYERLNRNLELTVLLAFSCATVFFAGVFLIKTPVVNVACLVAAIMSSNCAASMLWSRYCPSLRDTGMVSSATGFLDFVSYMAASISSKIFANAVSVVGWKGLIFVWFILMIVGVVVALPYKRKLVNPICSH